MGLLRLGYMRQIGDFNLMPAYMGVTLEKGNVWQNDADIDFDSLDTAGSLFLGIDTLVGPLYIGYGIAEGDNRSFYFYLGEVF